MNGEIALDTTAAIRYLNQEYKVVKYVLSIPLVYLPIVVIGELRYGAANSKQSLQNFHRYEEFINNCNALSLNKETSYCYATIRYDLKQKGRPIPENDLWIAAQCVENHWTLLTGDKHFTEISDLSVILI